MNKKFVALLLPLLVIPLVAVGYAHFSDAVVKKYKIHVGSVYLNVTGFHVDHALMPDVNEDGALWHIPAQASDELKINIYEGLDCKTYVEIEANPITGGFQLNTTMWMHNGGKIPFELDWTVFWDGPYDDDPCFGLPAPLKTITSLAQPPWSFDMKVYKWHRDEITGIYERTGPWNPTGTTYYPCDYIQVVQHVDFEQPDPAVAGSENWQKDWQCRWIKIWVEFTASEEDLYIDKESWTFGDIEPVTP